MINLQASLGAPPIVFPGARMNHPEAPPGLPGGAPIMPPSAAAQRALGCVGCGSGPQPGGIGDLAPVAWYSRVPTWVWYALGAAGAVGVGAGVYFLVRR